jgi:hypothetical protein
VLPDISHDKPGDRDLDGPVTSVRVLAMAGYAWFVHGNKPVSESEIKREMRRQAGQRR